MKKYLVMKIVKIVCAAQKTYSKSTTSVWGIHRETRARIPNLAMVGKSERKLDEKQLTGRFCSNSVDTASGTDGDNGLSMAKDLC